MLKTTIVAGLALALAACSAGDLPATEAEAVPARLALYVPTPEDVPAVQRCIDASVAFDTNRRPASAEKLDLACQADMNAAPQGACRDWALTAWRVAGKFITQESDGLRMAVADAKPAAAACSAESA